MLLVLPPVMDAPTSERQPANPGPESARRAVSAAQQARGRLLGVVAAASFALLALFASAFVSCVAASSGESGLGALLGGPALTVVMAMLMAAGLFVILRAAVSHDDFSRRLDGLCRELEASNARLEEVSFKDELTGLHNRRLFATRLADEVSRYSRFERPLSVVVLDVDVFKAVNDELGHAVGDETLQGIGRILERHSRSIDVICRHGGDEFAILLVETDKRGALRYAERIRRQIEAAAFPHGRSITVSLGVASLPDDVGPVPEDLLTAADWALYEAKRAGKNRIGERDGEVAAGRLRRGGWDL